MKQSVNYILHHKNVNMKMIGDELTTIDVAIYNALFLIWNRCDFYTDISISRQDVMNISKVGNTKTYITSLKRLEDRGYIIYKPSFSPLVGSKVTIIRYDTGGAKGDAIGSGSCGALADGNAGATLYKQYNNLTIEQVNKILAKANIVGFDETIKRLTLLKEPKYDFKKSLIDNGADLKLVSEWLIIRKSKKLSNTETALNGFLDEVAKSKKTINEVLKKCSTESWGGFKASWNWDSNNNSNHNEKKGQTSFLNNR